MEYQILTSWFSDDLESLVRKAISEGWSPCGGIAVAFMAHAYPAPSDKCYAQAMTRPQLPWNQVSVTITGDTGASATLQQINERMLAR